MYVDIEMINIKIYGEIMEDKIDFELLKEIRSSPRKMQIKYLDKLGILSEITRLVDNDFKIKEKIDIILLNEYNKCYCGKLSKPFIKWCSITCMNKDIDMRKNVSKKNTENSIERLEKAKQTRISKYGVSSVQDIPLSKIKTKQTKQKYYDDVISDTFNRYGLDQVKLSNIEYLTCICINSGFFEIQKKYFNNMPYTTLINHFKRIGFDPNFKKGSSSMGEQEIYNWIKTVLNDDILTNNRKLIGKELDIFIPSRKIAIEFNGIYWHSEKWFNSKGIDAKYYHKNKMELCLEKDIILLQFFEDEWLYKQKIVKSIILSKFGIFEKKYFARKLKVQNVPKELSDDFLDNNHLQGKCVGSNLGLYDNDELVCLMTYGKSRFEDEYEMIRFVSKINTQVIGGLSRLLSYVKKELKTTKIITYADLRYSTGVSYHKLGKYISHTDVGYNWVGKNGTIRLNRFSTQKHKLSKLFNEYIDLTKTENMIMEEHGYLKLYDCGNKKYEI